MNKLTQKGTWGKQLPVERRDHALLALLLLFEGWSMVGFAGERERERERAMVFFVAPTAAY